jgi:hypothetical protein
MEIEEQPKSKSPKPRVSVFVFFAPMLDRSFKMRISLCWLLVFSGSTVPALFLRSWLQVDVQRHGGHPLVLLLV